MIKLKNSVFTVLAITLFISSFLVLKPTKIYSEELVSYGESEELISYTIGAEVSKHTISGHVTDKMTGDPVKNAKIVLKGRRTPNRGAETDREGYFKIEDVSDDDYVLKIEKDGYKEYDKTIEIDGNDLELDVSLDFYTISGYITDKKTYKPMEGAKVTLNESSKSSMETETDNKGYFEFKHVSQKTHTVKIEKEGYSTYEKEVKVDDDDIKLSLDLKTQADPCVISGYVKDERTGEPISNVIVRLNGTSNWLNETDDKGYFTFEAVSQGTYGIQTDKEGYRMYNRSLSVIGNDRELDIRLNPYIHDIYVEVNNSSIVFDNSTGYPFIDEDDRTLVPLRKVLEAFGAKVEWDNDKKMVYATKDNNTVYIPANENYIIVNDVKVSIDSKAIIKNERTYCPVRAIIEGLEGIVTWDEKTKTVIIKEKGEI
ncbi:carboxypeptidase regulatory-like domain-containing protein [Wukongibacter baidiensis]|uniref:carboxypeptidase regulatory-like domain-containing protein n=1 Tax=Wukongibacter baidiensis TaxID=1723361 RepID=UPI003D7FD2F1